MSNKYSDKWWLFILIILSVVINIYFRLRPLSLPHIDKIAKKEIYRKIEDDLYRDVSTLFPKAIDATKQNLEKSLFNLYLKEKSSEIKKIVAQRAKEIKAYYQDERGWAYFPDTDPYRWLRRLETYLNTGHFGTSYRNNQEYDDLEFAPSGDRIEPLKLHFYLTVYFYKLIHFFNNKLSIMNCVSLIPVILSPLLVVSVFCICKLFGVSRLGSFLASLVLCLSPLVLVRTSLGWFDTDTYNLILPLIITSTLAYAFRKEGLKRVIFILVSGVLMGIYSALWSIWWFLCFLLIMGIILYKLSVIIYDKTSNLLSQIRESILELFLFFLSAYLSVLFISGSDAIKRALQEPLLYFSIRQNMVIDNFWPSVAFTVAELRRPSLSQIISFVGGSIIFYGGWVGILLLVIYRKALLDFREKNFILTVLFAWLLLAFLLTRFGNRFILFLITPLAIFFSVAWDILYKLINQKNLFGFIKAKANNLLLGLISFLIIIVPLHNAYCVDLTPPMNDSWWNMLITIKNTTPQESIINAWWPEGDWIMSIAQRATVVDSHWQYNSTAYWISRALLSHDEEEAFNIIKMIDSGGKQAFEELLKVLNNDKYLTLELINSMVVLKEEEGAIFLSKYVQDKDTQDNILKLIYGSKARPAYLIIHDKMIKYISDLSKIANWDFKRFDLWQKFVRFKKDSFITYAQEKLNYSEKEAQDLYHSLLFTNREDISDWITTGIYKFYTEHSEQTSTKDVENFIFFNNGLVVDKEKLMAYFRDDIYGRWIIPGHLILFTKGAIKENINNLGEMNYSVLLCEDNNLYRATMFSSPLSKSLFFKLYFMKGNDLKHFKLISQESKKGGANIYLYKIE